MPRVSGRSATRSVLAGLALLAGLTVVPGRSASASGGGTRAASVPRSAIGAAHPTLIQIAVPDRSGEIADRWLPGYAGPPRAKVLLPAHYDPARRYPLLVLLAGLDSNYTVWSGAGEGQIAQTAAGLDAIVVMPEGGSGWYVDWWNHGRRGDPSWESYYVDDVIPEICAMFPIRAGRRWHAIAGVSMGGLGAAYLGGRLPGFFGSVVIISGLVDTHLVVGEQVAQSLIPEALAHATLDPFAVYGPPLGAYSLGHDPIELAANLVHTRVFMSAGNGIPTDDGQPYTASVTDPLAEALVIRPASDAYAHALRAAGVAFTYQTHNGIHDWPNFRTELRAAIAWGLFRPVEDKPVSWTNDTVATHGQLWDVGYDFASPPEHVVRFRQVGRHLSISAAGSRITITTTGGCVVRVPTPASITLPAGRCVGSP